MNNRVTKKRPSDAKLMADLKKESDAKIRSYKNNPPKNGKTSNLAKRLGLD